MAEQSNPESRSGDADDIVVPTGEPLGGDDHDAALDTAPPWPVRASPYV
jgi:hypothetical protein